MSGTLTFVRGFKKFASDTMLEQALLQQHEPQLCAFVFSRDRARYCRAEQRAGSFRKHLWPWGRVDAATMFLLFVPKMRQALTFLATIENDDDGMKTLAVISILALLTISGAAYTDQLLTGDQQTVQGAD
jgi:hypothetical protein